MIFPLTARVNALHHLEIGGCDVVALGQELGTPLYIFDDEHLRARAREINEAFHARWPDSLILYATKAYFSPYLARIYKDAGLGIDVTSEGELEIARRVDFPRSKIYLHGNNKTPAELRAALAMGVEHVIVDNLDEIELLAHIAAELSVTPRVLLRLAPAIDDKQSRGEARTNTSFEVEPDRLSQHTHRYLATGIAESKFGLSIATGDALRAAHLITHHSPPLALVGLHVHIGSQIFELDPYRDAAATVLEFARKLKDAVGFELQELDLGGGWGVAYTEEQESLAADQVAEAIISALHDSQFNFQNSKLLFEPGRALMAQSAVALYTVGGIKEIPGGRTYVSVDGGMGDNVRPALYGAKYTARVANRMDEAPAQHVAIAGRYCEQGDILVEEVALPHVQAGDLIAIPCAGAYQIPMASNYNLIPRPAVIAVHDGEPRVIRRRETIDDMLRCEAN